MMLMAVAKYIYLPVTQDTQGVIAMATTRRLTKKNSCLLLIYVICLSVHFFWKGMMEKCQEVKKIYKTKLHVYKNLSFIIKGILCTVMEAFCTYNLRLPGVTEQVVEIPGEVIQQNRGQKNAALSLSLSLLLMLKIPGHMAAYFSILTY